MQYAFHSNENLPKDGSLILFAHQDDDKNVVLDDIAKKVDELTSGQLSKAMKIADFKAANASTVEVIAPVGIENDAIILVGLGKLADLNEEKSNDAGANAFAAAKKLSEKAHYAFASNDLNAADLLMGAELRNYVWDKYKVKKKDDKVGITDISVSCPNPEAAKAAWDNQMHVADGVLFARDLVNEPSNELNPESYAARLKDFESLGIKVELMGEKILQEKGFNTLLSVGKGSAYESHVVVMEYLGADDKNEAPVALVGKGVTFDTGGISLKPSAGMDEMKGDMGGSAAVVGAIRALAARKAKVNVVCVVGLVENMPSSTASKPGDIVTSLSGQTVENLNTDAEGRLVLADILWYTQDRFNPSVMIDAATLTGAMVVALGVHFGGFFTNDESLVAPLKQSGDNVGEAIWQMPLHEFYDKKIDTPNADVKNMGDRWGGAIYAAAFLQRFVNEKPWIHIDLAGTIFSNKKTPTSQGWTSGYGVRLIENFVAENYEGK